MTERTFPHREGTCGPECTYRRLYEGSQKSLNEMAGLQASALTRAGRLRAGIVVTLKRSFPALFQRAEKEMGRRLSEVDDELLLAYLTAFVEPKPFEQAPEVNLGELRSALERLGINVPAGAGTDVVSFLNSLPEGLAARPPALDAEATSTSEQGSRDLPVRVPLSALFAQDRSSSASGTGEYETHSAPKVPLSELFAQEPAENGDIPDSGEKDYAPAPSTWDGEVGGLDVLSTWTPSPVKAGSDPSPKEPGPPPAVAPPEEGQGAGTQAAPLRPQLFPTSSAPKSRRGSRRVRAQATPPENLDVPSAPAASSVPSGTSDQLLAMAGLPRPVFIRDLVTTGGSREAVEAWEAQCRADPATYPVRFVSAKSRHRMRGSLVLPKESLRDSKSEQSPWYRCMDAYRAAQIYEMGVLLHRVVDEVISADFSESGALLRLDSARGLVGVIVVFDPDPTEGSEAHNFLTANLAKLSSERLSLLAVLTTAGEERAVPKLVEVAAAAVSGLGGKISFPVVAARSWEYADDRGTGAVLVQEPA